MRPVLIDRLNADLESSGPGRWLGFVLPHGAMVAARYVLVGPMLSLEIRIARPEKPISSSGYAKWENELATFEKFLDLGPFARSNDESAEGVAVVYRERDEMSRVGLDTTAGGF
jgi:hypothetical protein